MSKIFDSGKFGCTGKSDISSKFFSDTQTQIIHPQTVEAPIWLIETVKHLSLTENEIIAEFENYHFTLPSDYGKIIDLGVKE